MGDYVGQKRCFFWKKNPVQTPKKVLTFYGGANRRTVARFLQRGKNWFFGPQGLRIHFIAKVVDTSCGARDGGFENVSFEKFG